LEEPAHQEKDVFTVILFLRVTVCDCFVCVSPQPYTTTRLARRLDAQDNRAKPLSHLLSLLRHMTQRPRYIVLENVKVGVKWCT
jgi:hypothetical protein